MRTPPLESETGMEGLNAVAFEAEEADSAAGFITPAQSASIEDALLETPNDDTVD
jgi:hypothetical protein